MRKIGVFCFIVTVSFFISMSNAFAKQKEVSLGSTYEQEIPSKEELLTEADGMAKEKEGHFSQIEIKHEVSPTDYIPVLMYHHFVQEEIPAGNGATVSIDEFEEHLQTFEKEGYTVISLEELYDILMEAVAEREALGYHTDSKKELDLDKKYLCITIDDGYRSNYELAFPLLKKYNMKADISVITSRIHTSYVITSEIDKLSWNDLNVMQDSGLVNIYNHTSNHKQLSGEAVSTFQYSVEQAENLLDTKLNKRSRIRVFTYPNGKYDFKSQTLLRRLGYDMQVTTDFGVVNKNTSINQIPRITVNSGLTGSQVLEKATAAAQRTFYPLSDER